MFALAALSNLQGGLIEAALGGKQPQIILHILVDHHRMRLPKGKPTVINLCLFSPLMSLILLQCF
jgi:hypothetical protein